MSESGIQSIFIGGCGDVRCQICGDRNAFRPFAELRRELEAAGDAPTVQPLDERFEPFVERARKRVELRLGRRK
ncbi:MAG: hypothetical protein C4523_05780 [Myxococcales bacterium]|nr:MAG: hypothetical protein C4523_05780 [Myxococcales bacterium]